MSMSQLVEGGGVLGWLRRVKDDGLVAGWLAGISYWLNVGNN